MEYDGCVVGLVATRGAGWLAVKVWIFLGAPLSTSCLPRGRNRQVTLFAIRVGLRMEKCAASPILAAVVRVLCYVVVVLGSMLLGGLSRQAAGGNWNQR